MADKIRVIELADLHNWTFGKDNKDLVKRIKDLKPDVIAIAGDMVLAGDQDISVAVSLCRQLVEIAPVYYSFGNHENEMVYGTDTVSYTHLVNGNAYFNGAKAWKNEKDNLVDDQNQVSVELVEEDGKYYLKTNVYDVMKAFKMCIRDSLTNRYSDR